MLIPSRTFFTLTPDCSKIKLRKSQHYVVLICRHKLATKHFLIVNNNFFDSL